MSTTAHFHVETRTPTGWVLAEFSGASYCSGWWPLLTGQAAGRDTHGNRRGDDFPAIGHQGMPADLSDATRAALLDDVCGPFNPDAAMFAYNYVEGDPVVDDRDLAGESGLYHFTGSDLVAVRASDADFKMPRWGYDKAVTLGSAPALLDMVDSLIASGVAGDDVRVLAYLC